MTGHRSSSRLRGAPGAFTLIELLVVIGVIGLLVSIVLVAGSGALSSSKKTQTERFLVSIASGLEQFKGDFGYYPPLLNPPPGGGNSALPPVNSPARAVVVTESGPNAYVARPTGDLKRKGYFSIHSLSAYLIGVGDLNYGGKEVNDDPNTPNVREVNLDDGADGPGFRNPGPDKSWGGAMGRNGSNGEIPETGKPIPDQSGRTYGPYLDIAQGKGLRAARQETFAAGRQDEAADPEHVAKGMYFLTDRWDKPIRYYRHWPTKGLAGSGAAAGKPSLNEVPLELLSYSAAGAYGEASDVNPQADATLLGAEFALLSAGEDGYFGEHVDEGVSNPNTPLTAGMFRSGVTDAKDRKKVLGRIRDNVRVTP